MLDQILLKLEEILKSTKHINNIESALFLGHFQRETNNQYFKIIYKYFKDNGFSVEDICSKSRQLMKDIVDMKQVEINDILQRIISLRQVNNIDEIKSIYDHFYPGKFMGDMVGHILNYWTRVTSVFGIEKNLEILERFMQISQHYITIPNFNNNLKEIKSIIKVFKEEKQTSVSDRDKFFSDMQKHLGELDYNQLEVFGHIPVELVEFYSQFKSRNAFDSKNSIITNNLVNDSLNNALHSKTISVYNYLEPFIVCYLNKDKPINPNGPNPGKYTNLSEFCLAVSRVIPKDQRLLLECTNKLGSVCTNLQNIAGLYATSGGVHGLQSNMKTIANVSKSSQFISYTSKNKDNLPGWSLKDGLTNQTFGQEKIEDMDQGIKFNSDRTKGEENKISEENKANMKLFTYMVQLLRDIHKLHCELDELYHHEYFNGTVKIDIQNNSLDSLEKKKSKLVRDINNWKESINKLPYELWLLRSHGLSSLIYKFNDYKTNLKETEVHIGELSRILIPYIKYSFPSITEVNLLTLMRDNPMLFEEKPMPNYQQFFDNLIKLIRISKPNVFRMVDSEEKEPYLLTGIERSDVLNVITQLNNFRIPHPSQVFYAEKFEVDHKYFFDISERFQGSVLFLIGIPDDKKILIDWLSKHHCQQTRSQLNRVYIISLSLSDGHGLFYHPLTNHYDSQLKDSWSNIKSEWTKSKSINSLNLVFGASGTGKSYYIKDLKQQYILPENRGIQCSKTISIRPGFEPKSLIDILLSVPKNVKFLIHFNVSPYTDFNSFDRFIYPLITYGFIIGNQVGEVYHVPESIKLDIYIELGDPLKESNFKDRADYPKQSISYIYKLSDIKSYDTARWLTTDKVEEKCFKAADTHDINSYLNHITQVVRVKEPDYNVKFQSKYQVTNFLRSVLDRLDFLDNYKVLYKFLSQFSNPESMLMLSPEDLYRIFVWESYKLSDPLYSSNKNVQKKPPLISTRYVEQLPPEPDSCPVIAQIGFVDFSEKKSVLEGKVASLITKEKALADPMSFKASVCTTFGIASRTYLINELCQKYSFVMTPDFGLRLMILHNKIKNQRSLVLTGDTGVGKTFILIFYSLMVNTSNNAIPSIQYEIKETINKCVDRINLEIKSANSLSVRTATTLGATLRMNNVESLRGNDITLDQMKDKINELYSLRINGQTEQLFQTRRANLTSDIQSTIRRLLKDHPLIETKNKDSLLYKIRSTSAETIDSLEKMIAAIDQISNTIFRSLFHRIIMHQRYTAKEFKIQILRIVQDIKEIIKLENIDRNIKMVVFIDEFNTAPRDTLALINEIFVDGTLDGEDSIPQNIFWIGAMNPKKISTSQSIDHTGQSTSTTTLDFIVNDPPPSMEKLFLRYGKFRKEHEEPFLENLFKLKSTICQYPEELKQFIILGQDALRQAKEGRVHMSIRDIIRTIDLYKFFMSTIGRSMIGCSFPNDSIEESDILVQTKLQLPIAIDDYSHHWLAMITSMALSYYLRVGKEKRPEIQIAFQKFINDTCKLKFKFDFNLTFKEIYSSFCQKEYTLLPPGIALTESLQLNIFFNVVAINCMIPLCIVGPPGCSKTLSFSIVVDNLKLNKINVKTPWALMPRVDQFHYQCTPHTTDIEIKQRFEQALNRQRGYDTEQNNTRCIVFLDEAGLVNEEESPMKVMHDYLDKVDQKQQIQSTDIAIVILSNKILDAAKTNRTLQLVHSSIIDKEDERALVKGCLFNNEKLEYSDLLIVKAMCKSYRRVNEFTDDTKKNLFHQRDFVYFLRHLSKLRSKTSSMTPEIVLEALERNFGGIHPHKFKELAKVFFVNLGFELPNQLALLEQDNTIDRIKQSLADKFDIKVNPNTTAFRYMMLLDPTENETSIMILNQMGVEHTVIRVGGFDEDNSKESLVKVVSQIKNHMSTGKNVVLVNSQSIDACFYEVFNKYFTIISDETHFLANVSFGNHSNHTQVHPDFKVIIHVPISRLDQTQLPWLNRFEKYRLSIDNLMNSKLQNRPDLQDDTKKIRENANHFVNTFHIQKSLLAGFSDSETIPSILYSMIKNSIERNEPMKIDPHRIIIKDLSINDKFILSKESNSIFKRFNSKLLQIARPETIYNSNLPRQYVEEYLLRQDHFNTLRFLQNLIKRTFNNDDAQDDNESISNKWIIYTRTSPSLHRLDDSTVDFKKLLLKFLPSENNQLVCQSIKIIQLNKLKSTEDCSQEFNKFIDNQDGRICIVIADMSIINQHQINYVVGMLNKVNKTDKLLVTICHYPPESSISGQFKLNSIFLNDLEFVYIDSIGVKLESSQSEDPSKQIDTDIRKWVAKTYGLRPVDVDDYSLKQTFEEMFYAHLNEVSRTSNVILTKYQYSNELERQFYTDNEIRPKLIEKLFKKHSGWFELIIRSFEDKWDKKDQFNTIISGICNLILTGKLPGLSILDAIKSSLSSHFYPVVSNVFKHLFNHLQFSMINSIVDNSPEDKLIKLFLESINIPENVRIEERYESIQLSLPENISKGPYSIPLFDTIYSSISNVLEYTLKNSEKHRNNSVDSILSSMKKHLESGHPMKPLIDHIDSNPELFQSFVNDYITRVLNYDKEWITFFRNIVETKDKKSETILLYPIKFHVDKEHIRFIKHLISPLVKLDRSILPTFEEMSYPKDIKIIKEKLAKKSVEFLSLFIVEQATKSESIILWCSVTREIFNRIDFESLFVTLKCNSKMVQLYCIYQFLVQCSHVDEKQSESFISSHGLILLECENFDTTDILELINAFDALNLSIQQYNISTKFGQQPIPTIPLTCLNDTIESLITSKTANIESFLKICDAKMHPKQFSFGYCTNILQHILNLVTKAELVEDYINNDQNNISFRFNPIIRNLCKTSLPTMKFLDIPPSQINQINTNSPLAEMVFHCLYDNIKKSDDFKQDLLLLEKIEELESNSIFSNIKCDVYFTLLLEKFASLINEAKKPEIVFKFLDSNPLYASYIKSQLEVIESESPTKYKMNQVYLLNKIEKEEDLINTLKSPQLLKAIGMEELLIREDITIKQLSQMPFTIDNSEDGKAYINLYNAIEKKSSKDIELMVVQCANPVDFGFFRLSLFLIAYQFYSEGKPTDFISSLLSPHFCDRISLTPFKPIFNKILSKQFGNTKFDEILKNAKKTQDTNAMANMMVNFIAVSIGCSNKCYLYNIFRDPLSIVVRPYPANEGAFKDCGMRYRESGRAVGDDRLQTSSMGGNLLNKFLISSTTWGAFSWTVSVCDSSMYQRIRNSGFVINDNNNTQETLTDYVNTRSLTSISEFMRNQQMKDQHVEPAHFMSELLYLIWKDSFNANSIQFNQSAVPAYEAYLSSLIQLVWNRYPQMKSSKIELAERQSSHLGSISLIRNDYSKLFPSPIYDMEFINSIITNQTSFKLLQLFTVKSEMIGLSLHFPALIRFLQVFYKLFNYRLSPEYINMTIPQCIDYLKENFSETSDTIETIDETWYSLKVAWSKITDHLKTMEGGCNRTPEYEKIIDTIDDSTLLIQLIKDDSTNSNGMIIDLINNWITTTQVKAMLLKDQIGHETIFDTIVNNDFEESDLETVPFDFGSNYLLIGSNFELYTFSNFLQRQISHYQTFDRSKFKPDFQSIENKLICNFLAGKVIGNQMKSYQTPFQFATKRQHNEDISSLVFDQFSTVVVKELWKLKHEIPKNMTIKLLNHFKIPFKSECRSKLLHSDYEKLCSYLTRVISHVLNNKDGSIDTTITIYEFSVKRGIIINNTRDIHQSTSNHLRRIQLQHLEDVVSVVTESYLAREYLYSNVMKEPDHYETKVFDTLLEKLKSEKASDRWISFLKDFINHLTTLECQSEIRSLQPNHSLTNIVVKYTREIAIPILTNFKNHSDFVPNKSNLNCYAILLRTFHEALSPLCIKSQQQLNNNNKEAGYKELHGENDNDSDEADQLIKNEFKKLDSNADDEDDLNDMLDEFTKLNRDQHNCIEPIKNSRFAHCLFNWIRFKPQTIDILPKYANQFQKFQSEHDKGTDDIDIRELFGLISEELSPTVINGKQPGKLLVEILETISQVNPLFHSIISHQCKKCKSEKTQPSILHLICRSLGEQKLEGHIDNAIIEFMKFKSQTCDKCNTIMEVGNSDIKLAEVPQYLFIDIDRSKLNGTNIEACPTLQLRSDCFNEVSNIFYETHSILYLDNKDEPNLWIIQDSLNCSTTVENLALEDTYGIDYSKTLLYIYKLSSL
ncbi:hypothetical protein PPL_05439 [Heterostelium album PN500]|uniref:AAA+ ATPase domain-containing protein n=1 Tax=Heterostelium pallidum (strain ATCC 26659 / Pp 5 / PN500) TaxID=670386 RepID=D3BA64_HETP5|nr:hypothetical protein PPL_05439 [Heterostelium album PN500]EFA81451.1 hypothetical protein PPL_05439 [Heterostelium album PN500]|eukprot:XP_020433569.1 hypothetical protein PPL_05439 [Heterostelium album PN500]